MAKTTIYISLAVGPQVPAGDAYVVFRSPHRFVSGSTVVLPEPEPVALAADGTGVVSVDAGVWLVDEILPTQTIRRAVSVPASSTTVLYSSLLEVTNPVDIGYGPTWAATAQSAAGAALDAAAEVEATAETINALIQQALDAAAAIGEAGVLVLTTDDPDPVWNGTPVPFFRYDPPEPPEEPEPADALVRGVYHAANGGSAFTSLAVNPSTPSVGDAPVAGDVLIAIVQNDTNISTTPTPPAGWTRFIPTNLAGITGTMGSWCFWKVREPGDTTYTFTLPEAKNVAITIVAVAAEAFANWTIGAVKARYETPTESTTTTAPSVTSARPKALALAFALERTTVNETDLVSASAGWTRVAFFAQTGAALGTLAIYKKALAAPGASGDFVATYPNAQSTNGVGFQLAMGGV